MLAAAAIASGTLAYADPVRFDDDGSFTWGDGVYLDLTKGVRKQTGLDAGRACLEYVTTPWLYGHRNRWVIGSTPDVQTEGYPITSVVSAGDLLPDALTSQDWLRSNLLGYYYLSGIAFRTSFQQTYTPGVPGPPGYIAARFNLTDGTHYGWMSLRMHWRSGPVLPNRTYELLAWGYETEPNTSIAAGAAPAPGGALAALALGAAAGATRGRRSPHLDRRKPGSAGE